MQYNDNNLTNDKSCFCIRQKFNESLSEEQKDLKEIYDKMLDQRNLLAESIKDNKYIIDNAGKTLNQLRNIITTNSQSVHTMDEAYGKVPHSSDIPNSNTNIPNNYFPNGNTPNSIPTPNVPNTNIPNQRRNLIQRRNPLQNSIFAPISSLFIKKNPEQKNRFHNTQHIQSNCNPRQKVITGQIDLIRLLLLFITLRPHCRYLSSISTITSSQFDILLNLI